MKITTIIVAAGSGQRVGTEIPKQFIKIANRPILMQTIENFAYLSGEIIVVINAHYMQYWQELCASERFTVEHKVVEGGVERFYSVQNGVRQVSDDTDLILVQDGARPFASRELIDRVVAMAAANGAAVPAVPITDSIRLRTDLPHTPSIAMIRDAFVAVQTPQGFAAQTLKKAYLRPFDAEVTDDATLVQCMGIPIHLVEGDAKNIKITNPLDIKIAEILW